MDVEDIDLVEFMEQRAALDEVVPADVKDGEGASHGRDDLRVQWPLPDPDPSVPPGPWYLWGPDPLLDGTTLPDCSEPFDRGAFTYRFVEDRVRWRWANPQQRPESLTALDVTNTIMKKLAQGHTWDDTDAASLEVDDPSMLWMRWEPRTPWESYLVKQIDDLYNRTLRHYGFLSPADRRSVLKLIQIEETLRLKLGREPSLEEVAEAYGPRTRVKTIVEYRSFRESVRQRCISTVPETGVPLGRSAEREALAKADSHALELAFGLLPPRSHDALMKVILDKEKPRNVAKQMGVTTTRVAELRREASRSVRKFQRLYALLTPAEKTRVDEAIRQNKPATDTDWGPYTASVALIYSVLADRTA